MWQSDKKQQIPKQSYKDLIMLAELPTVWLIIRSYNIFTIEVNGAFAINMVVHNSLIMQDWNKLKILDLNFLHEYLLIDATENDA